MDNDSDDALEFYWRKGVLQWGLPLAILMLLMIVAMAMITSDWSFFSGTLVVQIIVFFGLLGFCIGIFRKFAAQKRLDNRD